MNIHYPGDVIEIGNKLYEVIARNRENANYHCTDCAFHDDPEVCLKMPSCAASYYDDQVPVIYILIPERR